MDPVLLLLLALLPVLCFLILYYRHLQSKKISPLHPTEWPIVGQLPGLASNVHHFHDWATARLAGTGYSFVFKGVPGQRYFFTCDPANVHHIFTSNFANYPKGHEFGEIFDVFGGGILNADGESWRRQRVKAQMLFTGARFRALVARCSRDKVEKNLLPFLAHAAAEATPCNMQDLFLRLAFDMVCALVLGVDTRCLAVGLPVVPFVRAVDVALETIWFRHFIPVTFWKLMRRLNLGSERKMAVARQTIDGFVAETIAQRRADKLNQRATDSADILSSLLRDDDITDELIRDTAVNFLIAGRDAVAVTLSWFFYLVSNNLSVQKKLLDELSGAIASRDEGARADDGAMITFHATELRDLVYLHAALCECLRLYPAVPFEHKAAVAADVLPSGKELKAGDKVIILTYSMGRMEGVWGKDCMQFRPERWLNEEGTKLRYEPSYKFLAFNAGPRMCVGKDMAFVRMKTVAAAVLWNFTIEVVPGHVVEPKLSAILHMKNGLVVRVRRRAMGQ